MTTPGGGGPTDDPYGARHQGGPAGPPQGGPEWGASGVRRASCTRHPDRATMLSCSRCGRPFCGECLTPGPVGQQCPDCMAQGAASAPHRRTAAGGRARAVPLVTYVLIGLNVLVFLVTVAQSRTLLDNHAGSSLFFDWVLYPPYVTVLHEYVRIVGSGFLHYGVMHLLVNMLALFVLGRDCEAVLGRARYVAVYAVSLLGGSAAVLWFAPDSATAGASGAIYGLLGAVLVLMLRLRQNPTSILVVIGINLVISMSIPSISLLGHLGGLVAGILSAAAIVYAPGFGSPEPAQRSRSRTVGWIGVLLVAAVAVALCLTAPATFG